MPPCTMIPGYDLSDKYLGEKILAAGLSARDGHTMTYVGAWSSCWWADCHWQATTWVATSDKLDEKIPPPPHLHDTAPLWISWRTKCSCLAAQVH